MSELHWQEDMNEVLTVEILCPLGPNFIELLSKEYWETNLSAQQKLAENQPGAIYLTW